MLNAHYTQRTGTHSLAARLSACLYAESDCSVDYKASTGLTDSDRQPVVMTEAAL